MWHGSILDEVSASARFFGRSVDNTPVSAPCVYEDAYVSRETVVSIRGLRPLLDQRGCVPPPVGRVPARSDGVPRSTVCMFHVKRWVSIRGLRPLLDQQECIETHILYVSRETVGGVSIRGLHPLFDHLMCVVRGVSRETASDVGGIT